jgi:hypothetical protein
MNEQTLYSVEYFAKLAFYIRSTAIKLKIKQYYLYILYYSYMQYKRDNKAYISRYVIGWTISKGSISTVINSLIKLNLLIRVSTDTFCFTSYSIEVINYIDEQLSNLESK